MKKILLCALLLGGAATQHASAAIRTVEFTGTASYLRNFENPDATSVYAPTYDITVSLGDVITGEFSFDDQGLDFGPNDPNVSFATVNRFSYSLPASNHTRDVDGPQWSFANNSPDPGPIFSLYDRGGFYPSASLSIWAPEGALSWDLSKGTQGRIVVSFPWGGGPSNFVEFSFTEMSNVSPVPEPATWTMLLMGLGAAGVAAYRRRQS